MIAKTAFFIKKHSLIRAGDTVVLGLSGGADSVCLAHCLSRLAREMDFRLHAVHVHHGIRGEEADEDERFAAETAKRLHIPYKAFFVDVPAYAKRCGKTEEEAGRILRRESFAAYLREIGADSGRIALAHHMDDNAETVLFQMARGSGLAGMAGIRPRTSAGSFEIIRPLLCVRRREIEAWLEKEHIPYRTDRTNLEDGHTRNRIRHHVMPYLEEEIHAGAAEHIAAAASLAGEALDFIEKEAAIRCAVYVRESGEMEQDHLPSGAEQGSCVRAVHLSAEAFSKESPFMLSCILRRCLHMVAPHQQNLTRGHIGDLMDLIGKPGGKCLHLPGGIRAERTAEGITLRIGRAVPAESEPFDEPLADEVRIPGWIVRCRKDPCVSLPIPEKTYTKWIDFAIITDELRVRTRRPGDYLTVRADGAKKKLSDWMTDNKIPRESRDRIPLIADGQEIVWVVGWRLSERYKISEGTQTALRLEAIRPGSDGARPLSHDKRQEAGEDQYE